MQNGEGTFWSPPRCAAGIENREAGARPPPRTGFIAPSPNPPGAPPPRGAPPPGGAGK